jgi:hypothetical protein
MPLKNPEHRSGNGLPSRNHSTTPIEPLIELAAKAIKLASQINLQDPRSGAFQTPGEKTAQKKPGKPI